VGRSSLVDAGGATAAVGQLASSVPWPGERAISAQSWEDSTAAGDRVARPRGSCSKN